MKFHRILEMITKKSTRLPPTKERSPATASTTPRTRGTQNTRPTTQIKINKMKFQTIHPTEAGEASQPTTRIPCDHQIQMITEDAKCHRQINRSFYQLKIRAKLDEEPQKGSGTPLAMNVIRVRRKERIRRSACCLGNRAIGKRRIQATSFHSTQEQTWYILNNLTKMKAQSTKA